MEPAIRHAIQFQMRRKAWIRFRYLLWIRPVRPRSLSLPSLQTNSHNHPQFCSEMVDLQTYLSDGGMSAT